MAVSLGELLIVEPSKASWVFPMDGSDVSIGNQPGRRIVLSYSDVVARHALLRYADNMLRLFSPAPNTLVNNVLAKSGQKIDFGDTIQIGPCTLTYQQAGAQLPLPESLVLESTVPESPTGANPYSLHFGGPRTLASAPLAPGTSSSYLRYLPALFQDTDIPGVFYPTDESRTFLGRYLLIFETIWELLEQRQDFVDMFFDPATCLPTFLPWLARWFGIRLDEDWPEERQRRVVAEAFELYRWRGTRYGLRRMIELCTGYVPDIIDLSDDEEGESAQPYTFRVRLAIPSKSEVTRELLKEIIELHKPAHAAYILELSV